MRNRLAKRIERRAKSALATCVSRLWPSRRLDPGEVELSRIRRVLVVRPHNERGDMLLMVPLLRAIRECLPGREVTLLASSVNEEVMRRNPFLDRMLVLDAGRLRRRPWEWLALIRRLRRSSPDLAVLPNTVSYSVTSAVLTRLSGAPLRGGTESDSFGHAASSWALNLVVPHPGEELHESERNLAPLLPLGITTRDLSPLYVPSRAEGEAARKFLEGLPPARAVVVLHVGAGKPPNRWPAERFGRLAALLWNEARAVSVLTAGPGEEDLLVRAWDEAEHSLGEPPGRAVAIWRGASLGELAAVAALASLYVGNDTGPLHLAAAAGAPTIALLGPTDPRRWLPRAPRTSFVMAPAGEMEQLTVVKVWPEVRDRLSKVRAGETA